MQQGAGEAHWYKKDLGLRNNAACTALPRHQPDAEAEISTLNAMLQVQCCRFNALLRKPSMRTCKLRLLTLQQGCHAPQTAAAL